MRAANLETLLDFRVSIWNRGVIFDVFPGKDFLGPMG
jgi:hypothetical protein